MSQRDPSPDPIQQKNLRSSNKTTNQDHEDDWKSSPTNHPPTILSDPSHHLHRGRVESPLDAILGSIRHSRSRSSPIFPGTSESAYGSARMSHLSSDLTDIGPADSQKSRLHYPQNHQNNAHCQGRNLLPADSPYLQQLEGDAANDRSIYRHCSTIDARSTSPTSSSDAAEVITTPRHPRHRQHSSHRHRHTVNTTKDNIYASAILGQLGHRQATLCHRYHEIGQPNSCSPVCDSGMREDDASSSSNHRERLSSCEEEDHGGPMCSLVVTGTTTTTPMSSNILSPLSIISPANYHHRASSGISCESSTSSPSIRNHHGTLENCVTERQHRQLPRHNHVIQPYALDHPQRVQIVHTRETKSPLLIGLDAIQVLCCAKL